MEPAFFRDYAFGDEAKELATIESACQQPVGNQQDSRIQSAWDTVKSNLSRRPSFTKAWRRWSRSSISETPTDNRRRKSQDDENGLFCDALLGLMHRTGRFDYLDYPKEIKEK